MSDGTRVRFRREGCDAHRVDDAVRAVKTLKGKPSQRRPDCLQSPPADPGSIAQIELWAKVTVKIDRAIASIAVLLTMSPRLSL